ncbi:Bug family tripartite tricarboxylate transporter substrate binding protein [Paracraurococcus lichenis]|uniref:Tripartite tricarboxylate transporter substrate binding protein n=1 Tax=Paracraurococcus lichenis TaxID=3064888 RepID=A0ABT9DT34_9PROT|nr:tripartite tricarboxylate transporter substrate binding protein [Paracraurococcus sp. LOR1-02]MDO9707060.1 tripartite tricarboxylate transporter substrate binding protein [Paracraurococcus sp. LOR1-02]
MRRRALLAAALATPALAEEPWPARPIRLVVPFPPGGSSDFVARVAAERMARGLGQPVVIENRAGAGGNLGTEAVARAAPDGHTLGLGAVGTLAVNRFLFRRLAYDPDRDLLPISLLAVVPNLMVVPPALPVASVADFAAWARARGAAVSFGSIGNGTSQHLAGVQFNMLTGTRMVHVPYRDPAQVNSDLMEGRVQVLFQTIAGVADLARSGRMKPLAVTGEDRVPAFAGLPTLREAGVDVTTTGWFGLVAPAGVPEPVLARLEAEAVAAIADPAVAARIVEAGSLPRAGGRAAFARFIAEETLRMQAIVRASGAVAD